VVTWQLAADGNELEYSFEAGQPSIPASPRCCKRMGDLGIAYKDLNTHQSSLEDIFVSLVSDRNGVRS
jgi:ABC-2 type transport system ATP-binding protein